MKRISEPKFNLLYIILVGIIIGCVTVIPVSTSKRRAFPVIFISESEVDSLQAIVESAPDKIEIQLRYWFVDSLEERLPERDSLRVRNANLNSRNRQFRADFLDTLSQFEHGRLSRQSVFLDSSFNPISKILISSRSNLIVIKEDFDYQRADSSYRKLFALSSTTRTGFKFNTVGDFTAFRNTEKLNHYQWEKSHGTNYFISSVTGNDADDGLSWANAWITLGKSNGALSAGDTVFTTSLQADRTTHTTFNEQWSPTEDGTSGNEIIVIDSLLYVRNGSGYTKTDPDTVWGTKINSSSNSAFVLQGDDFWKVFGIWGTDAIGKQITLASFANNDTLFNVKSSDHQDGTGSLFTISSDAALNAFISCTGITASQDMDIGFEYTGGSSALIANCTFTGIYTTTLVDLNGSGTLEFKSNIFQNNSSTAADLVIHVQNTASVDDMDNNLYDGPSLTNFFNYNATTGNTIAAWRTEVQAQDADGEANALKDDPELKNIATSATILTDSPASGAGEDKGFGDNIGYFQEDIAPPAVGRRIFLIGMIKL